jgi:hypothetical protein
MYLSCIYSYKHENFVKHRQLPVFYAINTYIQFLDNLSKCQVLKDSDPWNH